MERLTLDVLRLLVRGGIGLGVDGDRLRITAGRGAIRTPNHREAVAACKPELLSAVNTTVLRVALGLPDALVITPPIAAGLACAIGEWEAFTDSERELYEERAAVREHDANAPQWLAQLIAIEDVVMSRTNGSEDSAAMAA
jgi:hypothetical protein